MVYLLLAIISSASVSIVMRLSEKYTTSSMSLLAVSYAACIIVSMLSMYVNYGALFFTSDVTANLLGAITGVLFLLGFVLLQTNIRVNGMVLSGTFAKLGVLVPTILSLLVFGERLYEYQIVGLALAMFAIWYMNGAKVDGQTSSGYLLIVLMLVNGFADFMSKVFNIYAQPQFETYYLFVCFSVACVLSVVLATYNHEHPTARVVLFGILLGVPNYFSVKFLIGALTTIPASIVYPTYSIATILVISLLGVLLFGEHLSNRQKQAQVIILLSLALLNI